MDNTLPKITTSCELYIATIEIHNTEKLIADSGNSHLLNLFIKDLIERMKEFSENSVKCPHCNSVILKSKLNKHNEA